MILNVNEHLAFSLQRESLTAPDLRTDSVPSMHHVTPWGPMTFQCLLCDSWVGGVRWYFTLCCSAVAMVITSWQRVACHKDTDRPDSRANRGTAAPVWWLNVFCNQWRQTRRWREKLKQKGIHMTIIQVWSHMQSLSLWAIVCFIVGVCVCVCWQMCVYVYNP